jgi:hypothetical protein
VQTEDEIEGDTDDDAGSDADDESDEEPDREAAGSANNNSREDTMPMNWEDKKNWFIQLATYKVPDGQICPECEADPTVTGTLRVRTKRAQIANRALRLCWNPTVKSRYDTKGGATLDTSTARICFIL